MIKIPLNNAPGVYAIIDKEDYEMISQYIWTYSSGGYASRSKRRKEKKGLNLGMHRMITDCPTGMSVHHINFNKLDNRKSNLLVCTIQENTSFSYPRKKPLSRPQPALSNFHFSLTKEENQMLLKYLDEIRSKNSPAVLVSSYKANGKFYVKNSLYKIETTELLDPSLVVWEKGKGYMYKGKPLTEFSNEYIYTDATIELMKKIT